MVPIKITKDKNRSIFEIFFGMKTEKKGGVMSRIKTFEDACEELGIEPNEFFQGSIDNGLMNDIKSIVAYSQLIIICRALNEGWTPDWTNSDQNKYCPYFIKKVPGFGFSGTDCDGWYSFACVGSRLCFKNCELAEYAGKQFESIYNDFLNL
jgi:hypothetical protein